MTVFTSIHHPGTATRGWMLLRAQARPVAFGMLIVMVIALAAVLQGYDVLRETLFGAGLVLAAGSAWGVFTLMRLPAELAIINEGFAGIRSSWEVLSNGTAQNAPRSVVLSPIWSVRTTPDELLIGVGDTVHSLRRTEWPDFEDMLAVSQQAASEFAHRTRPSL